MDHKSEGQPKAVQSRQPVTLTQLLSKEFLINFNYIFVNMNAVFNENIS